MYLELTKDIPNTILSTTSPLAYKDPQHVITEDGGWIMLEHVLRKKAPRLGHKAEDLQKYIYDLRFISSEDLASLMK